MHRQIYTYLQNKPSYVMTEIASVMIPNSRDHSWMKFVKVHLNAGAGSERYNIQYIVKKYTA